MLKTFRRIITIQAAEDGSAPSEIELLQTGEWNTPYHGHFVITRENLEEYKKNAEAGVRKGLPIDLEHMTNGGAVGWIGEQGFEIRSNTNGGFSLWGSVTWTPKGEQLIKDREFRFFSPEFADEDYEDPENAGVFLNNVLIGGGLTNRPLFKNLTAVAASDNVQKDKKSLTANSAQNILYLSEEHNDMNLAELLAKKTEDLTAEEKAFIVENKADLTDEQVTSLTEAGVLEAEGGDDDGSSDDDSGDDAGDDNNDDGADDDAGDDDGDEGTQASEKTVAIKASELADLKAKAAKGEQAHEQLSRKASEEHVASLLFNEKDGGKLPIAAKDTVVDFYHGLDEKQRKQFNEIVGKMPSLKMFSQDGDGGASAIGTAAAEVKQKAEALMADEKAGKGLTMAAAVRKVLASDSDLKERYNTERAGEK